MWARSPVRLFFRESDRKTNAKETAKEAYPKKQVVTWMVSQLLWRAGTRGVIFAFTPGMMEVRGIAKR